MAKLQAQRAEIWSIDVKSPEDEHGLSADGLRFNRACINEQKLNKIGICPSVRLWTRDSQTQGLMD